MQTIGDEEKMYPKSEIANFLNMVLETLLNVTSPSDKIEDLYWIIFKFVIIIYYIKIK